LRGKDHVPHSDDGLASCGVVAPYLGCQLEGLIVLFGRPHWAIAAGAMENTSARAPMPEIDFQICNFIDFSSSGRGWPTEEQANRQGRRGQ
jgi:hypothetical protein